MDSDEVFTLMMDALDGELSEAGWAELESHLRARPELEREWQAMRAVDTLLRSAPMLRPAVDLSQRTLARIPDSRQRLWAGVILYLLVLLSGLIPLGAVAWLALQIFPAVGEPAFVRGLWQAGGEFVRLAQVVLSALLKGSGELLSEQPVVLGWFSVMAGLVALWAGIYGRLVLHSRQVES